MNERNKRALMRFLAAFGAAVFSILMWNYVGQGWGVGLVILLLVMVLVVPYLLSGDYRRGR